MEKRVQKRYYAQDIKNAIFPKILIILLLSCGAFSIISLFFSELLSLSFVIAEVVLGIITFFYSEKNSLTIVLNNIKITEPSVRIALSTSSESILKFV